MAGVDFERVWRAYGRYGDKQASRRVYNDISSPDVNQIAERAASWAASAKPGQRRMPFEKWLEQERYDEADRVVRPRNQPVGIDDAAADDEDGMRKKHSPDYFAQVEADRAVHRSAIEYDVPEKVMLTVTDSSVEWRGSDMWLAVQTDRGRVSVLLECSKAAQQEAGQAHLGRLVDACGLGTINDGTELRGHTFMIAGDTFAPTPPQSAA